MSETFIKIDSKQHLEIQDKLILHWVRGRGGRKRRGKKGNLPNTFDDDCRLQF